MRSPRCLVLLLVAVAIVLVCTATPNQHQPAEPGWPNLSARLPSSGSTDGSIGERLEAEYTPATARLKDQHGTSSSLQTAVTPLLVPGPEAPVRSELGDHNLAGSHLGSRAPPEAR